MEIAGGAMSGYWAMGKRGDRQRAGEHHDDRDDPGEDRAVDEEADHDGFSLLD